MKHWFMGRQRDVRSDFRDDSIVMAPVRWLDRKSGDTTERLSDRKIRQIPMSAVNLPVTKFFGQMLPALPY